MDTPICDFVRRYAESGALRLHMPGHKGSGLLGVEELDITEIDGADSLYEAGGIIRQSERNAGELFGCPTFYSTEGSSHCIRAMLYLAVLHAKEQGKTPRIAAGRNAHKVFLSAAALLDVPIVWIWPEERDCYLSCEISPEALDRFLEQMEEKPTAVYLTSPDYLGNVADIRALARVAHRHGCLLLVDNAHGAYLKFLPQSRHPVDLGADACCDSAHKTLPVLTGGAYLHISPNAPRIFSEQARDALAMFGSTSPSYLILQSLDGANGVLAGDYRTRLARFCGEVRDLKERLTAHGFCLMGDEALKITLSSKPYGYDGREFARILLEKQIVCEFADPDFVVWMLTPETGSQGLKRLERALLDIPPRPAVAETPPRFGPAEQVMRPRQAAFAPCRTVAVEQCVGRVLARASVACPPAVPIVVCGERIDRAAAEAFAYYGIRECTVVAEEI